MEHKLAFLEREHYVFGRYSVAGFFHDCDKLLLYAVPCLTARATNDIHVKRQAHHLECGAKKPFRIYFKRLLIGIARH